MNLILIEIREDKVEELVERTILSISDFVVIGQYPATRNKEAVALLKTRHQAIKDASEAYKKSMKIVEDIDDKLNTLNDDRQED